MKPSTRDWVAKAEEDYLAALDLARRRKRPLWSGVCFHAQQSAEKYLKARLEEAGLPVPRTHDLAVSMQSKTGTGLKHRDAEDAKLRSEEASEAHQTVRAVGAAKLCVPPRPPRLCVKTSSPGLHGYGLDVILNGLLSVEPLWAAFRPALQTLTDYAVDFRYPGHTANKSHARRALTDCKSVRREVRASLGLPV